MGGLLSGGNRVSHQGVAVQQRSWWLDDAGDGRG